MELTQPWERQPAESEKAYSAFRYYRDMPAKDRSIRNGVKAYYGSDSVAKVNQWMRWSGQFGWQDRVRAWEEEQDRVAREAKLQAIKDMNERHLQAARAMFGKAMKRFAEMEQSHMGPRVTLDYLVEAIKLERLVRGEPESIVQQNVAATNANVELDLSRLTDEQLRTLEDIARAAGGADEADSDRAGAEAAD